MSIGAVSSLGPHLPGHLLTRLIHKGVDAALVGKADKKPSVVSVTLTRQVRHETSVMRWRDLSGLENGSALCGKADKVRHR